MLFINKQAVTRQDLANRFKIDLAKIEKRPEFEATKKIIDRVNGGRIKSPAGHNLLCKVMVADPQTGLPLEIRFAESNNQKVVGDRVIDKFKPRQIVFSGSAVAYDNTSSVELDKALYVYLYHTNSLSPLRTERSAKPKHEFIDLTARAEKRISGINQMGEAILHATQISGPDALIFAKGLGITNVEQKDEREVRADLMDFAQKSPAIYLEKKNSQLTIIEGRIVNFVDKGIFKLETFGTVRRWSWTAGPKEGEIVTDIINTTQDARTALKNHIFNNINEFLPILNNLTDTLNSRQVAESALKAAQTNLSESMPVIGEELPQHLKQVGTYESAKPFVQLPQNFQECTEYCGEHRGNRSPGFASKLNKAIQAGEVNGDNIQEFVANL